MMRAGAVRGLAPLTVAETLRLAAVQLAAHSDTSRLDAELLMAHALGVTRSEMLLRHMQSPVPDAFESLLQRRLAHEPVAYITGAQEFYGLNFKVTADVLIPRADSETLVEAALKARPGVRWVLDCGTGSGALLLAVLAHRPDAQGLGIDSSAGAVAVATENARNLGLSERSRIELADWQQPGWAQAMGQYDLILANPPYVEDAAEIALSVRDHEPAGALFAGPEGLDAYRVLVPQLPDLLAPGGAALVEIGYSQAAAVTALAEQAGLSARLHRDLAGRARVLELVHRA